jgi:mannosyltransferase OCH1-like enzyme
LPVAPPIPPVLHRIVLPPMADRGYVRRNWRRLGRMHRGWTLRTWSEPSPVDFPETFPLLEACRSAAQRADILRLELLWRHGGIYVDTDCEPVRPLDPLLGLGCFFGSEDGVHLTNSVIGATPGHPAIRAYLDAVLTQGRVHLDLPPNEATGPVFATEVLAGRDDVVVLPPAAFYPEPFVASTQRRRLSRRRLAGPDTYLIHRWAHSWKEPAPPRP